MCTNTIPYKGKKFKLLPISPNLQAFYCLKKKEKTVRIQNPFCKITLFKVHFL